MAFLLSPIEARKSKETWADVRDALTSRSESTRRIRAVQRANDFVVRKRLIGSARFCRLTIGAKLNNRVQLRIYFFDPRDLRANHFLA